MKTMIKVENLVKKYGEFVALDGISFELNEGEVVGILGPNGAGKTTLLHILSGVLPASSGKIELWGRDVTRLSTYDRLRMGLARSGVESCDPVAQVAGGVFEG